MSFFYNLIYLCVHFSKSHKSKESKSQSLRQYNNSDYVIIFEIVHVKISWKNHVNLTFEIVMRVSIFFAIFLFFMLEIS